jgi:arylsulfatase
MGDIEFGGVIGETWRESTPWWPPERIPPAGAPNILLVVLDDVGYAQLSCYGSDLATPRIDALAADGVRLANFHTTALCSPTRACLLTGRNHHSVGMGRIADLALGFPGHSGSIGAQHGFLSEILGQVGYAAYAVGKWHLTPEDETHMAASRRTWPVGRGFQRWYGFHGGETHQFVPTLFQDNQWVAPPARVEDGYHLSEDLAAHAISYLADLRSVEPDTPFLLYFATGACHSPHHAPDEWIERYAGQFDDGWDAWRERTFARQVEMGLLPQGTELSPRPPWVPAWSDLPADEQRVAARFMECFAGFLSHADAQIGRVLDFIEHHLGEADDTVVVVVSDNGASAEGGRLGSINDARMWNGIPAGRRELQARIGELGGPTAHNNYPWGWTMAGNTPFRRWKREVHEGGVADPCVVRWPNGLTGGGAIRHQYAHAVDVLPTLLELSGVQAPATIGGVEQSPIEGASFASVLRDGAAPPTRTTQYFEMLGSRALYHDGWKAVTFKPLAALYDDGLDPEAPFSEDRWELYHVASDFSECHDVAENEPERLAEMIELWWSEARAHNVLPLDNRPLAALLHPRPTRARDRERYVYFPLVSPVPESVAVNVRNRSHSVVVDVEVEPGDKAEGVLLAQGSVLGGWTFFIADGSLEYEHNVAGKERHRVHSDEVVPDGRHRLGFDFEKTAEFAGVGRLYLDGEMVGEGEIPFVTPARLAITGAGLTCGYEVGPAISTAYVAPFTFTGRIERAVVDVSGQPYLDLAKELAAILTAE